MDGPDRPSCAGPPANDKLDNVDIITAADHISEIYGAAADPNDCINAVISHNPSHHLQLDEFSTLHSDDVYAELNDFMRFIDVLIVEDPHESQSSAASYCAAPKSLQLETFRRIGHDSDSSACANLLQESADEISGAFSACANLLEESASMRSLQAHDLQPAAQTFDRLPSTQTTFVDSYNPPPSKVQSEKYTQCLQPAPAANYMSSLASALAVANNHSTLNYTKWQVNIPDECLEYQYHGQFPHLNLHSDPFSLIHPKSGGAASSFTYTESMNAYPRSGINSDFTAMKFERALHVAVMSDSLSNQTSMPTTSPHDQSVRALSNSAPPHINSSMNVETAPGARSSFHGLQEDKILVCSGDNGGINLAANDIKKSTELGKHNIGARQQTRRASLLVDHPPSPLIHRRSRTTHPAAAGGQNVANYMQSADGREVMNPMYDGSRVLLKVKTRELKMHDGYEWKKYGEKVIKKDNYTRSYYRCAESRRTGCKALKRVQRCSEDGDYVDILYLGRHNHHLPA